MTYEFIYNIPAHYHCEKAPDVKVLVRATKYDDLVNTYKIDYSNLSRIEHELTNPEMCYREIFQLTQIEFEQRENRECDEAVMQCQAIIDKFDNDSKDPFTFRDLVITVIIAAILIYLK